MWPLLPEAGVRPPTGPPLSFTFLVWTMGIMILALQDGCVGNKHDNVDQGPHDSIQMFPCHCLSAPWHQPPVILSHLLFLMFAGCIESACFLSFPNVPALLPPSCPRLMPPGPMPGAPPFPSLTPLLPSQCQHVQNPHLPPARLEPSPPMVGRQAKRE